MQQQDAANSAKTEATSEERIRIMGSNAVGFVGNLGETRSDGSAPESREDPGASHYFEGATYAGLLGAGAAFGQQEAARRAAAAAIKAIFICGSVWFDS